MDDLNPFDQFSNEFAAALPKTSEPPSPSPAQLQRHSVPTMNTFMGNNQAPPPPPMGGQPAAGYHHPTMRSSSLSTLGNSFTDHNVSHPQPGQMTRTASEGMNAMVPSANPSNPYASMLGGPSYQNNSIYGGNPSQQWGSVQPPPMSTPSMNMTSQPPPSQHHYGAQFPPHTVSNQGPLQEASPNIHSKQINSQQMPLQGLQMPPQGPLMPHQGPPMPPQPPSQGPPMPSSIPPQQLPPQPLPPQQAPPTVGQPSLVNAWDDFIAPQPAPPGPPQNNSLNDIFTSSQVATPSQQPDLSIFNASAQPAPPVAAPQPFAPPPFAAPPVAAPSTSAAPEDPWGSVFSAAHPAPPAPEPSALVVSNNANNDPFGLFGTSSPAPPPEAIGISAPAPTAEDMWAEMGFDSPKSIQAAPPAAAIPEPVKEEPVALRQEELEPVQQTRKKGDLPPGGEWYDARIFTPTLGVMFFKPSELTDSLFLQTDPSVVAALDDRPVVAFIVEGSSARSAGVELGHVLLKVNGIDVKNPKEASRLIKEGPRPLPLLFYVPDTQVVVAEGEHMVKYDTRETGAPPSAKDWKPKYVVIGGIIAQPWMMNMYRSKSEYDIAVIETQARRPVSVKVKQFSLQGARIQNDWQGPQMVKYKNKLHPWKYIVVLPVARNPIKISSPNLSQLKPVHEGIRRVLLAQQRSGSKPSHGPTAGPVHQPDPYASEQRSKNRRSSAESRSSVEGGVGSARRRQQNGY